MKSIAKDYPTSLGTPVNKVAQRVISKGFQYEPNKRLQQEIWEIKPPTIPMPDNRQNLLGTRQNRMQIVGCVRVVRKKTDKKTRRKTILLARCDCGKFEERVAENWQKMKTFDDCCQICRHNEFLKYQHETNEQQEKRLARMKLKHNKIN